MFRPVLKTQRREVLDVHLDPLAWHCHGIADRPLAGVGAALPDQACPLEHPVGPKHIDRDALSGEAIGQAPGPITGVLAQGPSSAPAGHVPVPSPAFL